MALACRWREERLHGVPSKGIRKSVVIKRVQDESGNEARVERERHGRRDGAKELSLDSRVGRER